VLIIAWANSINLLRRSGNVDVNALLFAEKSATKHEKNHDQKDYKDHQNCHYSRPTSTITYLHGNLLS
jgi:hypothetical protein